MSINKIKLSWIISGKNIETTENMANCFKQIKTSPYTSIDVKIESKYRF